MALSISDQTSWAAAQTPVRCLEIILIYTLSDLLISYLIINVRSGCGNIPIGYIESC